MTAAAIWFLHCSQAALAEPSGKLAVQRPHVTIWVWSAAAAAAEEEEEEPSVTSIYWKRNGPYEGCLVSDEVSQDAFMFQDPKEKFWFVAQYCKWPVWENKEYPQDISKTGQ